MDFTQRCVEARRIVDSHKMAIEDPVSVVGNKRPARYFAPDDWKVAKAALDLRPDVRHRERYNLDGQRKGAERLDEFDSVTTTMYRSAQSATAFSRKSAPPPPFVNDQSGATSSAPSIATAIGSSKSSTNGIRSLTAQLFGFARCRNG